MTKLKEQMDTLCKEPTATELENMREKARQKRDIIYDCFNAIAREDGHVYCSKWYRLRGKIGDTIPLLSVMKGISPICCKKCPDFNGGE